MPDTAVKNERPAIARWRLWEGQPARLAFVLPRIITAIIDRASCWQTTRTPPAHARAPLALRSWRAFAVAPIEPGQHGGVGDGRVIDTADPRLGTFFVSLREAEAKDRLNND
jgi:hypothetical protein